MKPLSSIGPGDWPTLGARSCPDAVALRTPDGVTVGYQELETRSSRLAASWLRDGIVAGDRIAFLDTDGVGYTVALFAALKIGAVTVPLNFRLSPAELSRLVAVADPVLLLVGSRYAGMADDLRTAAPALRDITTVDDIAAAPAGAPESLPARTSDDDTLVWMLTSGTTGTPRVVAQSQRMLKANTAKGVLEQSFTAEDRLYAGTPLFHVAGMGWLFYAISRGASLVVMPQFDAPALLRCLAVGDVTRCLLVPSMAAALLDLPGVADQGYPALRGIAYGGASMPPTLVRRLHETFGCDLYNTFGAGTEGGGQTILRPADHRAAFAGRPHLLGSIGRPQYGVDLRICDAEGNEVGPGEIGEIRTRSDTVMSGYVGRDDLTADKVADGWVRGGDLAHRDAEGYVYLAGRADDMIVRGGENIFPAEIESVLAAAPGIAEVAVVGVPDDHWGQIVVAAVVGADGHPPDADAVRAHCRTHLASYKVPAHVVAVDSLPRNAAGKTRRRDLAADLAARVRASVAAGGGS